jgi:hypothetical protein
MPFDLQSFKSNFKDGGSRPSLFDIQITFPVGGIEVAGINNIAGNEVSNLLRFTARAASIPPSIIGKIEVPYFGRRIKVDGNREYPDWRVVVMSDENYVVRAALEAWHEKMNAHVLNIMSGDYINGGYKATAIVRQYRRAELPQGDLTGNLTLTGQESVVRSYIFEGIFPTGIGGVNLGWDQINQIAEYEIEFAYDWWQPIIGESERTTEQGVLYTS